MICVTRMKSGIKFSALSSVSTVIALLAITTLSSTAKPDFGASEVLAPKTVVEGNVARFQVRLHNGGDEAATSAEVTIRPPVMGHLIEVTGLEQAKTNDESGDVTGFVSLTPNSERMIEVAVLAPRDSAGASLSLTTRIIHYHTMAEMWVHGSVSVDTRPRTDGVKMGGFRLTTAGLAVVGWLAATALALVAAASLGARKQPSFFGPTSGVLAIMIAIGFWLIFATMAWRDYRSHTAWKEATATIIGRRVQIQSVTSQDRSTSRATSRQTDVAKPEFALRYKVDGRDMLSTGYDTGSFLRVGGGHAQLEKEFREWTIGAQVPCWFDPDDPTDVVLKRGPGGAYVFALLPLLPFLIGCWILRRAFGREGEASES